MTTNSEGLDRLSALILAKDDPDPPAPHRDITEAEILKELGQPLGREMERALAEGVTIGGETQGAALGVQFRQHDPDVQDYLKMRSANLITEIDESTARMVRETLLSAYNRDATDLEIARAIAESGAFAPSRAATIARTESHSAVQAGVHEGMKQAGVERRQWLSSLDAATRPSHLEAHGQEQDSETPFQVGDSELMYPGDPDGPPEETINCFLPGTVVSGRVNLAMRSRYAGPVIEITTRSGTSLTVTPNHPVCTSRGVLRAEDVGKNDNLIRYSDGVEEFGSSRLGENDDNVPSKIEEIFSAFRRSGGLCSKRLTARDLHGDAVNVDGNVDVVLSKRFLRSDRESSGRQFVDQLTLVASDHSASMFPRDGGAKKLGLVPLTAPRLVLDLQSESFGRASRINSSLREYAPHGRYGDPEFLRDFLEGCPGLVPSDDLIAFLRSDLHYRKTMGVTHRSNRHARLDEMSLDHARLKSDGCGKTRERFSDSIPLRDVDDDVPRKENSVGRDVAIRPPRTSLNSWLCPRSHGVNDAAQANAGGDELLAESVVADPAQMFTFARPSNSICAMGSACGVCDTEEGLACDVSGYKSIEIRNDGLQHAHCFPVGSQSISLSREALGQPTTGVAESRGEGRERFAGLISLDEVVEIRRFDYRGFVFDVQSPYGWIIANGLLCLQCRCTLLSVESTASADDLAAALDMTPADGAEQDDDIEERITEATADLPDNVVARVDPEDVGPLQYQPGKGRDADYDVESATVTVGPKATSDDLAIPIEQHVAASIMSASDARGLRNQLVTADLVSPAVWDALAGTERARAVEVMAAIIADDREAVEAMLGSMDDRAWKRTKIVGSHFWVVGRTGGRIPKATNPK